MTDIELANGKVVFECLRKTIGEEAMRKLQTMLNLGYSDDFILLNRDQAKQLPNEVKELMVLCYAYMRQEMPVAPWRGR